MLQAGYVFCHRCGHATEEAYYFNSKTATWVQLFRTLTGKFTVARYIPPYMKGEAANTSAETVIKYRLAPTNENRAQGLQHEIEVEYYINNQRGVEKFVRACPFCVGQKAEWNTVQSLLPGLGNLPTFVIAVVGARTVGKSCWIHAISSAYNINRVNEYRINSYNYSGYSLSTEDWAREQSPLIKSTEPNERGKTRMMLIKKKVGEKSVAVAQVLMMDFAGELFAEGKENEFESEAAHIFKGGAGYSGVDAVVFMTDPKPERGNYSLATTYARAKGNYDLLQNKPVAFVMNKVDMLIDNPQKHYINDDENMPEVKMLTEHTFAYQGADMYQKSYIQARVALQTSILKHIHELVKAICNETRGRGFLVKSTEPYDFYDAETGKTEEMLDFKKSINVMDPLLWILNELDIFPIDD